VRNGTVRLDNGTPGQAATWAVGLDSSASNHRWLLSDVPGHLTSSLTGQAHAVLPVFFPTEDQPLDPNSPRIALHVNDLAHPPESTTPTLPDFEAARDNLDLGTAIEAVAQGWEGVLHFLRTALAGKIAAAKIPVVGSQLQHALDFLQQM